MRFFCLQKLEELYLKNKLCLWRVRCRLPAWSGEASGTGIASNEVPPDPLHGNFVGGSAWISSLQRKAMEKKLWQRQQEKLHPPALKESQAAAAFHKHGFYQGVRMKWNLMKSCRLAGVTLFHLQKNNSLTHLATCWKAFRSAAITWSASCWTMPANPCQTCTKNQLNDPGRQ